VPRGKPSPKLAITVDPEVHERVVAAAAADGLSVSAWMTAAARRALLLRDGLAAVSEWEQENAPLTDAELRSARERIADEIRGSGKRRSA
jgi:DNA-binding IclR family transcriptional regulator